MLRLIIVIFCLFFFLVLAARIIVFLYDSIGQFPIWETEAWKTLKVPVIAITVILGVAALLTISIRASKKHDRAEKEFALAQGWTYTESDRDPQGRTQELAGKIEKICPEKEFDLNNSMAVRSWERNIYLFNCRYRVRDWGPKKSFGFGCLIESDRLGWVYSQVDVSRRDSLEGLLLSNQVDMGDSEFSRSFIVTSKDPAAARRVLSLSLQAVFLESKRGDPAYFEINIGPGGVVTLTGTSQSFQEYLALVDLARRIESAFE